MKIRIFEGLSTEVEYQIQQFFNLLHNKDIEIVSLTQSEYRNLVIITIIYKYKI